MWYTCIRIYSLYIHGGVGVINLDSPLTEATGAIGYTGALKAAPYAVYLYNLRND